MAETPVTTWSLCLEEHFQSVLDHATREGRIKPAETTRIARIVVRHCKVRMIEDVEELNAKLEPGVFRDRKMRVLED